MRGILSLVSILISISCFSQEFLYSDDYIYGMGSGKTVFAADSSAILSLSMSLRTGVVNTSSHTLREIDDKITSIFKKEISLDSSIDLLNTRNYVKKEGDEYVVYRYFNKRTYINERVSKYKFFMEAAEKIKGSNVKHEKNLILGYYYLAYSAIDTPIMDLYADVWYNKKDIENKAKEIYNSCDYGFLMLIEKKWNGYEVSMGGQIDRLGDTEPIELIGFEYFNKQEWLNPVHLSSKCSFDVDVSNDPNTNTKYRRGLIETENPRVPYRILYEKYENGRYIKIEVPDEWYFIQMNIRNPMFLP